MYSFCVGAVGNKIIPCFNDYCPSVTQKGNILLAVYATPKHRDGLISRIFADNMSYITWPRHYFEAEARLNSSREWGSAPHNIPGVKVSSSNGQLSLDDNSLSILQGRTEHGKCKNSWWCGMRDSCYVGVYCSHETDEVFKEEKRFPKMQMFPEDPKNFLPRRVCSRPNHAWVVVVGDTIMYPTFSDFLSYCKSSVTVHVERRGNSYYYASVSDTTWQLSTQVEK